MEKGGREGRGRRETEAASPEEEQTEREKHTCTDLRMLVQEDSVEHACTAFKGCLVHEHRDLCSCVMHRSHDHATCRPHRD